MCLNANAMCDENLFSTVVDGQTLTWSVERLWEASQSLPVQDVPVVALEHHLDEVVWFETGTDPTARAVAEHSERIYGADLNHPLILSAGGDVMDGWHRLAKAWMLGVETIKVRQFAEDPEPDWIE